MHPTGSYALQYIVPVSILNNDDNYPKLLQRRQELTDSDRKLPAIAAKFEQTLTFVENLKCNQQKPIVGKTRLSTLLPKEIDGEKKPLTPQQLCYQLNLKLEYLIRTRAIEQHRVISRTSILPTRPIKTKTVCKESLNRSVEKTIVSSSMTTINSTATQEDLVDKDSIGDNDEACEEMVEEENVTLLQQQQQT